MMAVLSPVRPFMSTVGWPFTEAHGTGPGSCQALSAGRRWCLVYVYVLPPGLTTRVIHRMHVGIGVVVQNCRYCVRKGADTQRDSGSRRCEVGCREPPGDGAAIRRTWLWHWHPCRW